MLLVPGRELEYSDSVERNVYRGRVFYVEPNGRYGYAIPTKVTPVSSRNWKPFDHNSKLRDAFNWGPASKEDIDKLIIPDAPPFYYHVLNESGKNKVKLGSRGAYGGRISYAYCYEHERRATLGPSAAAHLPEPYLTLWNKARPHCYFGSWLK